nr:hypothetical protein NCS320_00010 [Salmonella enterica]
MRASSVKHESFLGDIHKMCHKNTNSLFFLVNLF